MIAITAASNFPLMAKRIAVMPAQSASKVSMLGIMRLIDTPVMRRTRGRRKWMCGGRIMMVALLDSGRSMGEALARRLLRPAVGDHRLAPDHALAGDDERDPSSREIDIGAAAEADDAEALPGEDRLALAQPADDAPRYEAGDLHHGEIAAALGRRDADRHPLIVLARLVETGIDEFALAVVELDDAAGGRDAVDMDVEDIEEDADAHHRCGAKVQLGRRHGWGDREDAAI